jgi:hypothetical protein
LKTFKRIVIWLGLMGALTLLSMGIWYIAFGGSQTTESLKWLQCLQTAATFLLPAIIGAWIWSEDHQPFKWLKLDRTTDANHYLLAVGIMVCALPAINLLADLNGRIRLPESLDFIEQQMKQMEEAAAVLTERFLQADSVGVLLINIGLMALLPALAEELSFRGTLQQILRGEGLRVIGYRTHVAIWITAFIFSAIHMQFYGFIPRMLMGAMFGYIFLWAGCLWVPVLMHFTNNALAVIAYYITSHNSSGLTGEGGLTSKSIADTFGAGDTWWVGVLSLILTSLGLLIFYRRTHTR